MLKKVWNFKMHPFFLHHLPLQLCHFINHLLSGCGVTLWPFSTKQPIWCTRCCQLMAYTRHYFREPQELAHRGSTALLSLLCWACTWPGIAHIPANRLTHSYLGCFVPPESQAQKEKQHELGKQSMRCMRWTKKSFYIYSSKFSSSLFFFSIFQMTLIQSFHWTLSS